MQSELLAESDGQRTFVVVPETGDEVMACLSGFATRERLSAAQFSAIGAFSDAEMSYFDWETKAFRRNPVHEQAEVASLNGDVALGRTASRPSISTPFSAAATAVRSAAIRPRAARARRSRSCSPSSPPIRARPTIPNRDWR